VKPRNAKPAWNVPSRWSNGEGHVDIEVLEHTDRGDRGNVGIIRSPIRASILPDHFRHEAFCNLVQLIPWRGSTTGPSPLPEVKRGTA
jgi:hypothetical protein